VNVVAKNDYVISIYYRCKNKAVIHTVCAACRVVKEPVVSVVSANHKIYYTDLDFLR